MIKVTGNNLSKTMTIGNIYRPPRTCNENITKFIDEFSSVISSLENSNNNLIIAGDFNINLLKINENRIYSDFFDTLISHSLYPQITFPTRFTKTNGTLIDNFFCKLNKSLLESIAGIFTKTFSDHQPYFLFLDNIPKIEFPPKFIKINTQSEEAMQKVKIEIDSYNCYNKLHKHQNEDPNLNYNIMHEEIMRAKNKYMPIKIMKFNKYKHKNSTWITQGLLKSIRYRDTLYKQLKMSDPNSPDYETTNAILKTYNSILKRNIRVVKNYYFESRFNRFKNDKKYLENHQ